MKILVLNAGSSSQKSCLYELSNNTLPEQPPKPLWEASIDWTVASGFARLKVKANEVTQKEKWESNNRRMDIAKMLDSLSDGKTRVLEELSEIDIVGHRVVHGGAEYSEATLINPEVKEAIARLSVLAPVHNPANLEGIEAIETILGSSIPQVAVFDTAFHSQMPQKAAVYPIPYEWFEKGIRRYGFHGISHKYCAGRAAQLLGKPLDSLKLITCHLGNGCSLAAIKDGISIDTTMGFTPLEGLMMGNRSGSIDPAILIHLLKEYDFNAEQLDEMLNKNSGFKGISGISADLRTILEAIAQGNERAQLAFNIYIHRLRAAIGAMVASLGGLDALIFTAGIGENSSLVREEACAGFEFLNLKLDLNKNASSPVDKDIAAPDSAVRVLVVSTAEDWAIAQECWQILTKVRESKS
ncbi:acetate kinase [Pleurocapsales cyanobacterium LEGE 06147]|nr:acetate kinase [Pleurocapsales cyanobacterium LEGE 06147]